MDIKKLYIIGIVTIILIMCIVCFIAIKRRQRKQLREKLEELERGRNLIVATPVMTELDKVKVIINNSELEGKYKDWNKRYDIIKNQRYEEITDKLLEVDNLLEENDYKEARVAIVNLEMEIYKLRVSTDNLLDEIREVTMSEERNRAIVTKLKSRFRELERTLESNKSAYGDVVNNIELQFENIEKKFSDFEEVMEQNEYEEVVSLVKVLDEMIAHIGVVVEELPDLILLTDKILPNRIKEVRDTYEKLVAKDYPLEHMKVPYNLEQIENKVNDIKTRIKILNLEDSMFELKTFLDYLDNLFTDFEIEKKSKRLFDETAKTFKIKLQKVNRIVTDIYNQLDDIKNMYNLDSEDLADLEQINKELFKVNNKFNDIIGDLKNKNLPYSKLKDKIMHLSSGFGKIEDDLNLCLKSLGSMHDDEMRAREQLDEITELLKKCRAKIRHNPLPIISNNYFVELSEANDAIYEIVKELEKTPITIKTLNIRVDTARDLSLKLYSTTNEMVKTAKLCEMSIMYGNRYKPVDKDIEQGLDVAGQLFMKGNYKKALETALAAINIIEPDIYKKMLHLYKEDK
ncbi:MAG: septation ring formation regulator EzrA [Bacilli bacterium]|nr:septation ring formation regulator EzrA [Bacilli bacterium]